MTRLTEVAVLILLVCSEGSHHLPEVECAHDVALSECVLDQAQDNAVVIAASQGSIWMSDDGSTWMPGWLSKDRYSRTVYPAMKVKVIVNRRNCEYEGGIQAHGGRRRGDELQYG